MKAHYGPLPRGIAMIQMTLRVGTVPGSLGRDKRRARGRSRHGYASWNLFVYLLPGM